MKQSDKLGTSYLDHNIYKISRQVFRGRVYARRIHVEHDSFSTINIGAMTKGFSKKTTSFRLIVDVSLILVVNQ